MGGLSVMSSPVTGGTNAGAAGCAVVRAAGFCRAEPAAGLAAGTGLGGSFTGPGFATGFGAGFCGNWMNPIFSPSAGFGGAGGSAGAMAGNGIDPALASTTSSIPGVSSADGVVPVSVAAGVVN